MLCAADWTLIFNLCQYTNCPIPPKSCMLLYQSSQHCLFKVPKQNSAIVLPLLCSSSRLSWCKGLFIVALWSRWISWLQTNPWSQSLNHFILKCCRVCWHRFTRCSLGCWNFAQLNWLIKHRSTCFCLKMLDYSELATRSYAGWIGFTT